MKPSSGWAPAEPMASISWPLYVRPMRLPPLPSGRPNDWQAAAVLRLQEEAEGKPNELTLPPFACRLASCAPDSGELQKRCAPPGCGAAS